MTDSTLHEIVRWPNMPVDTYAAFERATGGHVKRTGDMWWRRVRPSLYRPLLPFKRFDIAATAAAIDTLGVFQHGVSEGQPHNSHLNPVVFDNLREYDPAKLRKNVRSQVRKALQSNI